jgi:hypothetical protein
LDTNSIGAIAKEDLEWVDKWRPVEWVYAKPDPEALKEVKALLLEKYGHPLRAWRVLLDADDSNNVDWNEFKNACTKLKFRGSVAGAWRVLDVDLIGRISMKQFDPDSAKLLASFKEWAEANFGSISHCFKQLDTDRSGSLTYTELRRASLKMNWQGDVRLLFDCLDVDRVRDAKAFGKRSISFDEISFLDTWEYEIKLEDIAEEPVARNKAAEIAREKKLDEITERLADLASCQRPARKVPAEVSLPQSTDPGSSAPDTKSSSLRKPALRRSSTQPHLEPLAEPPRRRGSVDSAIPDFSSAESGGSPRELAHSYPLTSLKSLAPMSKKLMALPGSQSEPELSLMRPAPQWSPSQAKRLLKSGAIKFTPVAAV